MANRTGPVSAVAQSPDQIAAAAAAARAAGRPVRIFTAPWMAGAWGVCGLAPDGGGMAEVVLDCGADAATALAALRSGWKRIAFNGRADARRKLEDIADRSGAALIEPPERPDVTLRPGDDAKAQLRGWLAANPGRAAAAREGDET